ncbi:hypothetical protein [Candidatus Lokiarchaeum ossiferum]|uniref:hypothetical protein n=1 Tax=Candidatus Lokiarchaeum ossiferum TaxID=2951803 RepID=UPI00352EA0CC
MALSFIAYLTGISAVCIFLLGVFYWIRFLIYFGQNKSKKLTPLVGFLALFLGGLYLGASVNFIAKLFWNIDIDLLLYGYLTYIHTPIGISLAMFLGYDIFKPKLKWKMFIAFLIVGIVYLIAMLGWPEIMIDGTSPNPNELVDISINSVVLVIVLLYILSCIFMLGVNFILLGRRLNNGEPQKKAYKLGIGWFLFGIAGILDSLLPLTFVIIPRVMMFIGLVLIFQGFAPIKNDLE